MEPISNEMLKDIVKAAKKSFCDGIYVPCKVHPCGWDFLSFDQMRSPDDVLEIAFDIYDISGGIYDSHPFHNKTLRVVLEETKGLFAFEQGNMKW